MSESLPELVGLCPVHHAGGCHAPIDPDDADPKCPACGRRVLVYVPRTALEATR